MPDGTTYSYDVALTPSCQQLVPIDQVAIGFTARPGTTASLAVLGSNLAFVEGAVPGPVQLFDDTLSNVFDTLKYRLTQVRHGPVGLRFFGFRMRASAALVTVGCENRDVV